MDARRSERSPALAGGDESIPAFLAAIRPPLEFLARASDEVMARTRLPAAAFATRGRALAAVIQHPGMCDLIERLSVELDAYAAAPVAVRRTIVGRSVALVDQLAGLTVAPRHAASRSGPLADGAAPAYRRCADDPGAAIAQLNRSVQFVRGVGPRRAALLGKFGITTVNDLLYHLPFRYEDRREIRKIVALQVGEEASVIGEITHVNERVVGRARRHILEAVLRDETGLLGLTWYHHVTYFRSRYRLGQRCLVHGRVERPPGGAKRMVHPEIDLAPEEAGAGIVPVYNKPTTMTVGAMRKLLQQAVQDFAPSLPSALPPGVAAAVRVTDLAAAMQEVHLPAPDADVGRLNAYASHAHRSLVFDELFFLQLGLLLRRRAVTAETGLALPPLGTLSGRLEALLPFHLTRAQRRVIKEIHADMARPHPMHRLVQGDVGSGKTIVALAAAVVAIENGHQVAFMAPTELLAEQHFQTVQPFAEGLGIHAVLLTGEASRGERARAYEEIADGRIQLAIGTHALIQAGVRFRAIGLGVIDEQHRFGVLQRAALRQLGQGHVTPDILLMTATPIPRTLSMTIYGDLDVSVLDELPPGRQPVRTMILNEAERQRAYQLVKKELDRGQQGYVVHPLVESSEKENLRDATTMAQELRSTVFAGYRVGLMHGKMKAEEKDAVMRRFRAGDLQLLVSTTVIEVGVDVPRATIMVVEHAERFGLSQLHQLRGRVGRGDEHALCILVAPYHQGADVYRRLRAMADTADGFKIAEVDLELRGPGEFLGTRQSGLPDFRVANLIRDHHILAEARRFAEACLERDPKLESEESALLRTVLKHRWAGKLGLAEIG